MEEMMFMGTKQFFAGGNRDHISPWDYNKAVENTDIPPMVYRCRYCNGIVESRNNCPHCGAPK